MTNQSKPVYLADKCITDLYNYGSIISIVRYMDENVIGYSGETMEYVQGKQAMKHLLQKEHEEVSPCRVADMRFRELKTDTGVTVKAAVTLRSEKNTYKCEILFMFVSHEGRWWISGMHLSRNVEQKKLPVLNAYTGPEQDDEDDNGTAQSVSIPSAYITYHLDQGHKLCHFSDEFWRMLGYLSREDFIAATGGQLMSIISEDDWSHVLDSLSQQLQQRKGYQLEYRVKDAGGRYHHVMECGRRTYNKDKIAELSSVVLDITPIKKTNDSLVYRAKYDELTGIYNRNTFYKKVEELIKKYPDKVFEIMRIDVERFKVINDLFGEKTGDNLLRYIAGFFSHLNLPLCAYGRLHSDNFVICFPEERNNRQRFITSLKAMAASFSLDYRVVLCFGVYRIDEPDLPVSVMCDRASLALNKVKGNELLYCGEYDEKMRQHIVNEQGIVNEMEDALSNGEFIVYLQPKYDLESGCIVGAEALVRWNSSVRGFIPPSEFIPVFEHNGFIFRLDYYVWEETCKLLRRWLDEGRKPLPVSVNVSRVDLVNKDLIDILVSLVRKYDLAPELLQLEITESAYMDNPQQIIKMTKELQKQGFIILMDDFGSGYSSLNMLKDLPVDILKIDMNFLVNSDNSERGGNILNSIVRMAKWLKLPVIVEGVETHQQVGFLRMIGCDCAQGYYYSRPVEVAAYEKMLDANQGKVTREIKHQRWLDYTDVEGFFYPSAQFNILYNTINVGIGLYEMHGDRMKLIKANDGYFGIFGYDKDNFSYPDHDVLAGISRDDVEILQETILSARIEKTVKQCLLKSKKANGASLWLNVSVNVVVSERDWHLLYLAIEDVTAIKHKTREMEELFKNIPIGLGVYELCADGEIRTHILSSSIYELNLESPLEYLQHSDNGKLSKVIDAEIVAEFKEKILASVKDGKRKEMRYSFVRPNGEKVRLKSKFKAVAGTKNNYFCYVVLDRETN